MFKKRKIEKWVYAFIILSILLSGCSRTQNKEFKRSIFALNTFLEFTVYGDEKAENALENAIMRITEIESRMSATIESSDVSRINKSAGIKPIKVHEDTLKVIQKGLEYGKITEGAFDITIYPIVKLWGVTSDDPKVPSPWEVEEALELVDYRKVLLSETDKTVYLEKLGMQIDLGGIAKGYAADEAADILRKSGVKHAVINLGGDVMVIGDKVDGKPWRIGIRDPRPEDGEAYFGVVETKDKTVVTSGDYERYMEKLLKDKGIRYHHIFDPKTGYPTDTQITTTTIIGNVSTDADALSTALFIMGVEKGLALINKLEDVDALIVTEDKTVYTSQGWEDELKITKQEYRLR